MSTTQLGQNWRLTFGNSANPEVFQTLGGEKSFDWTHESTDVDTSDKDGPSGVLVPGRIKFSVQGNVKLPDPAMSIIAAAVKSGAFVDLKVTNGAIVKYAGPVSPGNLKVSAAVGGTVPYSFDMSNSAPPTIDTLDATA